MQNLRLDQASAEVPWQVEIKEVSTTTGRSLVHNLHMLVSIFLIGMAAGNIYHPYQGMLAISAGLIGILTFACHKFYVSAKQRQQFFIKEKQLSASLNERLKRHVAHSFRPHNRKRRGTLIADRYRKLDYVPIANVDEI